MWRTLIRATLGEQALELRKMLAQRRDGSPIDTDYRYRDFEASQG